MLRNAVSLPARAFRLLWDSLRWDRPFIRNVLVVALPMVIQQLMTASLHIVDGLMVSGLGDAAYSAVTQANRVTFMFNLFSFGTCTGGAIFLSQYWGGRDIRRMRQTMGLTMMFVLIVAAVFMSVSLLMPRQIISLFLPQGESFDRAVEYLSVVAFGYLFTAVDNVYAATLKAAEKTYLPMLSGFASILTNTVLNYAFIFGKLGCPAMGISGAAIATVLSQLASCVYAVRFLLGKKPPIRITRGGYSAAVMRRVLTLGFSPFIIIALDNVMIIAMNAVLQHYGGAARGDALVTCATIAQSFMLVVTMPLGGITGGTQSILSYNYGAYRTERVRQAQKYIFGLGLVFTAVMTLAARLAGPLFVRLFTTDEALAAQAFDTIKVCTLALLPLGLQYEVVDGFTALGLAKLALPLSLWRKAVYFAAVFALPAFFGADAVFYAEPISDVLGPLASVAVYCVCIRGVLARRAALAPQKLPN